MPTIRDIAQLAGVSQGTVSNVLNGKGIVSSEKIRQVQAAAEALGYTVNERARLLRRGKGAILAVILPNLRFRHYVDFYLSFKSYAENRGYSVLQYISNDDPGTERAAIASLRSAMVAGLAVFSCLAQEGRAYEEAGFAGHEVLFVERRPRDPEFQPNYMGFDYARAGMHLAELALESLEAETGKATGAPGNTSDASDADPEHDAGTSAPSVIRAPSLALVTDNPEFSNEAEFIAGFFAALGNGGDCRLQHIVTDILRRNAGIFQLFGADPPQAIVCSNHDFAQTVKDVRDNFHPAVRARIHTLSPIFTMPENDYAKYELNYRLMGKSSAEFLIINMAEKLSCQTRILENTGIRKWEGRVPLGCSKPGRLELLTLDSPAAEAMRSLSPLFTRATGIEVGVSVFAYESIHEVLASLDTSGSFDVLRLDVTWLPWFAGKILRPLESIDPGVASVLDSFVEGIGRSYSFVGDTLYALPVSPSNQLLFYRKDLFESTVYRRLYQEAYHEELRPPRSFAEFNRIARFFSLGANPQSPLDCGYRLTLGSLGVAATEFLTRYFSYADSLFDAGHRILLSGKNALHALEDLVAVKDYSGEGYNAWWTAAARDFAAGNVAMSILYSNFASEIVGRDSKVLNRVGFDFVPGPHSIIGGGTLGVSRYSRHPEAALALIRWFCSEPVSSALSLLGSVPACRRSFDNYEIVDTYPWLELSRASFARSGFRRAPSTGNAPFDERSFLGILGKAVMDAWEERCSPQDALMEAQREYTRREAELSPRPETRG